MAHHPFRFGVVAAQARSGDEGVARARRAEALGYSTFLIPDTLGQTLAPLPALAVAAAATRSIRVGTYVLANGYRNPVLVAREAATLDFLSNGRFELGLGAGRSQAEEEWRKLGLPVQAGSVRVDQLGEALAIIKALLAGQTSHAAGAHYTVAGADLYPRPVQQPHPPILIAARGKRLLALAAREANIIAIAASPDTGMAAVAETIEWLRTAAGDRFEQLELNRNVIGVGSEIPPWLAARMVLDAARLQQSGAPSLLLGSPDDMCAQLERQRSILGVSYITVSDMRLEALAPVVERLAGR